MALPVPQTVLGGARMTDGIVVPFEGPGAGVGDLTWGQRKVWTLMQQAKSSLSMGGAVPVTDGRTVQDLASELAFFMSRYASMRALIRSGPDGTVSQVVAAFGEATLGILDVPDDADDADSAQAAQAAQDLADQWEATPFDHTREWPIRMAAVRAHGAVTHVVVTISHVATDAGGIAAMLEELGTRDPLTGEPKNPEPAMGPLELAALQRTASGLRQSEASLRHWERLLRTAAPQRFGPHVDRGEPRYRRAYFTSRALHLASKAVAARLGVPASTVLLAAYAASVVRLTGIGPALIQVVVSNRFRPGLADVSHPLSVNGLLAVDVRDAGADVDASFDEVVSRTQRAMALCSKYAYYDPTYLEALRTRINEERGEAIDLSCLFNDRRLGLGTEPLAPSMSRSELEAVQQESTLRWAAPFETYLDKLMVQVGTSPDTVELEVQVDTHHVSVAEVQALVLDMESLLVLATP